MPTHDRTPAPIRACIFDMDGLLLNTEDQISSCVNRILSIYCRVPMPWSLKAKIQGRAPAEAKALFREWAQLPISPEECSRQLNALQREVFPYSKPLPGVEVLLGSLRQAKTRDGKGVELALASSSSTDKLKLKTKNQKALFSAFPPECRVLGDDPDVEEHKPAPDVYLCALECANQRSQRKGAGSPVQARECLVFEDAMLGAKAGLAAGMQVLWCPHPELLREICEGEKDEIRADVARIFGLKSGSLIKGVGWDELTQSIFYGTGGRVRLLRSLERYPYHLYGIEIDDRSVDAQL